MCIYALTLICFFLLVYLSVNVYTYIHICANINRCPLFCTSSCLQVACSLLHRQWLYFSPRVLCSRLNFCVTWDLRKEKRERNKTDKRENETGERQEMSGVSPYTGSPLSIQGTTTGFWELSPPASCNSTRSLPSKSIGLASDGRVFRLCSATQARLRYGMHMRDRGTAIGNSRSKPLTRCFGQEARKIRRSKNLRVRQSEGSDHP